nr:hypothetical protein CTI12_AA091940 [Tanacetum cinerariifolium]
MGRDANNQMYPIAWAVVRFENADNWGWFLHLLHDDLSLNDRNRITIISDSHKCYYMTENGWSFPVVSKSWKLGKMIKVMVLICNTRERRDGGRGNRAVGSTRGGMAGSSSIGLLTSKESGVWVKDTTDVTTEDVDEFLGMETSETTNVVEELSAPAVDKGKGVASVAKQDNALKKEKRQEKKTFEFDKHGIGSTPDKAFDVFE